MTTRNRPRQIDRDVQAAIERLGLLGWTPSQVHRELTREDRFRGRVPSDRTIQRIVKELRGNDNSARWTLRDAEGDDARLLFEVIAAVVEHSHGRRKFLTKDEASLILALMRAFPDMSPLRAFQTARLYLSRESQGQSLDDMDASLAFPYWRTGEEYLRYETAFLQGWIDKMLVLEVPGEGLPVGPDMIKEGQEDGE